MKCDQYYYILESQIYNPEKNILNWKSVILFLIFIFLNGQDIILFTIFTIFL